MGSLLMEKNFRSPPNGVLTAHTEWLPDVRLRHLSTTCAEYIKDCGAGDCPVVVAWWQSTGCTSQVSLVRFAVVAGLFTFLYFRLKNI